MTDWTIVALGYLMAAGVWAVLVAVALRRGRS
jgi:hypothetical protein